jgi:hypothetical protein
MRVLRPVVETLVLPVLNAWHNLLPRRSIAGKLVGDHDARRPALPLQQLAQQPLGCALITPALDQDVEHDAVLVDRAPEPMLYPGDFDDDVILSANSEVLDLFTVPVSSADLWERYKSADIGVALWTARRVAGSKTSCKASS